jgi:hypothetical protein
LGVRAVESTTDAPLGVAAAAKVREAVDAGAVERESYRTDEIGQNEYCIRLVRYQ